MDNEQAAATPQGTWLEVVPVKTRVRAAGWRIGLATALTAWLFYAQFQNNAPTPYMLWGFGIMTAGLVFGIKAFHITERRVFDSTTVTYTQGQRIKRALPWLAVGVVMPACIWWVQASSDQLSQYWWYAWPSLFPLLVGIGLYLLRHEQVISASGQHARSQLEAVKSERAREREEAIEGFLGNVLGKVWVRYAGAAGCIYMAYWFATDSTSKNAGWGIACAVIIGLFLARELSLWVIGIGVVISVLSGLFAGLAALPVSVAIIIGALIIASSLGKK